MVEEKSKIPFHNRDLPNILAIETSTRQGSLALSTANTIYSVSLDPDFGQFLVSQIDEFLQKHQQSLKDLALIVLGAGPGSYTGLRIGFAVALTLSKYNNLPLRTVPSTHALAYNYQGDASEIAVALDARQKEFYFGTYQKKEEDWIPKSPLTVVSEISTSLPCLGDAGPNATTPQGLPPKADRLLTIGFQNWKQEGPENLNKVIEPLYLRPTEAERRLLQKQTQQKENQK